MDSDYPEKDVEGKQKSNRALTLKFASPLSVTRIESFADIYIRAVCCAIGIGLSQVFMGAVLICIIIYGANYKSDHAVFCGLAYHFFVAEAILTLSYINGWSTPMRSRHKRLAHIVLQICGCMCAAYGIVKVTIREGLSTTVHGFSGAVLAILTIVTLVTGPLVVKKVNKVHILHMTLGITTFLTSSICTSYGLMTPEFTNWAGSNIVPILIGFIIFYSALIAITTFMKCMKRF